ncbi:MAG: MBL fold metallo-hydrolase [Gemmatimonadetes bacterium]|nr:MBL fold metallo-hydrolase [Gemmatimonadota bacterium]MDA1103029.1 MBL fold metallo-hydrolase [Gemmatimonadota bacterium]
MKLTFLGTGTSFGVPIVGCDCSTCTSSDPRDQRTRHGALVDLDGGRLLVDTPPELRLQLLAAGVDSIDALWFTHVHADHIHGIDDVRVFTVRNGDMSAFVAHEYMSTMQAHFQYIFDDEVLPPVGSSKPKIRLQGVEALRSLDILGHSFTPVRVPHGDCSVYGFRVGGLGYITDGKALPTETLDVLRGVDVLVLNALWFGRPHASHFNVEEAVAAAREVGAARTYLTHLTHRVSHQELLDRLPEGVFPAYDGLTVEVDA